MFAQREGLEYDYPVRQHTMAFMAETPDDLATVIQEFVERFIVKTTNIAVWQSKMGLHYALVTFEKQKPGER